MNVQNRSGAPRPPHLSSVETPAVPVDASPPLSEQELMGPVLVALERAANLLPDESDHKLRCRVDVALLRAAGIRSPLQAAS